MTEAERICHQRRATEYDDSYLEKLSANSHQRSAIDRARMADR